MIVWGEDREKAIAKMSRALQQTHIAGLSTNVPFVRTILAHPEFVKVIALPFSNNWFHCRSLTLPCCKAIASYKGIGLDFKKTPIPNYSGGKRKKK